MVVITFPPHFDAYGGSVPDAVYSADGSWFVAAMGKLNGAFGQYVWRVPWDAATRGFAPAEYVPLKRITPGRGQLAVAAGRLWLWSWDAGNKLTSQEVPGWMPPADNQNKNMWMT